MSLPKILTERVLTFAQAADACPSVGGTRPAVKTIYFWADTGLLVSGSRVKLECARYGRARVTSAEAIERFFTAINGTEDPSEPVVSPADRQKASDGAVSRLRARFAKRKNAATAGGCSAGVR